MSLLAALFTLQILGGNVGIPLILLTVLLSKRVHRHPLLVNFLCYFVIYSFALSLLLYLGQLSPRQNYQTRSYGLCLFQAALSNAISVIAPLSGLFLIVNVWMSTHRFARYEKLYAGPVPGSSIALIISSWIALISLTVFLSIAASYEPASVGINSIHMACTVYSPLLSFVPFLAGLFTVGIIVFEGLILYELIRKGLSFSVLKSRADSSASTIARTGVFSVYAAFSLVAAIGFGTNTSMTFPHIIQSSLPFAAFLVFGAQKDILAVWGVLPLWNRLRGVQGDEVVKRPAEPTPPNWSGSLYPMGLDVANFRLSTSQGSETNSILPIQPVRLHLYGTDNV